MAFEDFRKSTLKVTNKRHHKIKGSLGIRDSFKWCRENKWLDMGRPLTEKEFYAIIRTVNKLIAEEISQGKDVRLPQKMGQIEVRKFDAYVKLQEGKLHSNRKVDWIKTLKLWYEDEEAKESKTLVRMEYKEHFKIFYCKIMANYPNKTVVKFKPNRELGIKVTKNGQAGLFDAYKIGR